MLASVKHGFVLICNPKSASTALESVYRKHANFDVGRGSAWKHLSWREYRGVFGDYFDRHGCTAFAVARSPTDLLVSWWRFRQRSKIQNPSHPHHRNSTIGVPFRDWVEEWASDDPPSRARIIEQREVLMGDDGAPAPMHYYRFEEVERLVAELNERIGVDVVPPLANVSPKIEPEVDLEWLMSVPRLKQQLAFYDAIQFS